MAVRDKLGVWTAVEKTLTHAENVRASLVLVARGEVPLRIVYATDALAQPRVRLADTFAALFALGLGVYLLYAMLKPESFRHARQPCCNSLSTSWSCWT